MKTTIYFECADKRAAIQELENLAANYRSTKLSLIENVTYNVKTTDDGIKVVFETEPRDFDNMTSTLMTLLAKEKFKYVTFKHISIKQAIA